MYAQSPILKLPFLAASIICNQLVNTAPNPPPLPEERAKYRHGILEGSLVALLPAAALLKQLINLLFVAEALLIVFPSYHGPSAQATEVTTGITTPFVVGFTMAVIGAVVRLKSYRQLGRSYTFELAVRKEHQLVTGGIYSVVRHPGYLGGLLFLYGAAICQLGRGSYWEVSGVGKSLAGYMFGWVYLVCIVQISVAAVIRTGQEDRVLRAEFRDRWDTWASSTQYRLVPFVY